MATEPQTTTLVEAMALPAYDSLHPDQTKQESPPVRLQQVCGDVQLQQGVPFQAWPQGQASYQQPAPNTMNQQGPVQYIAVSDRTCTKLWRLYQSSFNHVNHRYVLERVLFRYLLCEL
jgi:hypothetical protein